MTYFLLRLSTQYEHMTTEQYGCCKLKYFILKMTGEQIIHIVDVGKEKVGAF